MQRVALKVWEVHQTDGDYVVIFDADLEITHETTVVKIEVVSLLQGYEHVSRDKIHEVVDYIQQGIEEVLKPQEFGAFVLVSKLCIHEGDYKPRKYKHYAVQYLEVALGK